MVLVELGVGVEVTTVPPPPLLDGVGVGVFLLPVLLVLLVELVELVELVLLVELVELVLLVPLPPAGVGTSRRMTTSSGMVRLSVDGLLYELTGVVPRLGRYNSPLTNEPPRLKVTLAFWSQLLVQAGLLADTSLRKTR
jgi:hypothetical protein